MLDLTRAHGLTFLFPERDSSVGHCLKHFGEFAQVEIDLIGACLDAAEPGVMIDVGANLGAICLPLASRLKTWRFVAAEAHRGMAQVLGANALMNHLHNVEVINAAVGAEERIVDFPAMPLDGSGNFGVLGLGMAEPGATHRVRMCALDELAGPDTRFVKVDVEGAEAGVIAGATRTIEAVRPVFLLEHGDKHEPSNRVYKQALMDADYDLYWFFSPFLRQGRTRKSSAISSREVGDPSVLAVPKGGENPWGLTRIAGIDDLWPPQGSAHRYLTRYGFPQTGPR